MLSEVGELGHPLVGPCQAQKTSLVEERGHPLVGSCQAKKTSLSQNNKYFCVINFDDNRDFRLRAFMTVEEGYAALACLSADR
jgi:hypothetical protein